jgi:hypothetical protein
MLLRSGRDLEESQEPLARRALVQDVLIPGGLAGTLGGLLSLFAAAATSGVLGYGPGAPLRLVAGVFWRQGAGPGAWPLLIGAFIHLAGAAALGTGFALLLPRGGTGVAAVGLAFLLGLGVYATTVELLVQPLAPPLIRLPALALLPFTLLACAPLPVVVPVRRALDGWVRVRHRVQRLLD